MLGRRRHEQRRLVAEDQPDAAVVGPEPARADPHDVARRAQRVEIGRRGSSATRAGSTSVSSTDAGDRRALQHAEHLDQRRRRPRAARADALPRGQEAGERAAVDRLDLVAQRGQRSPPQLAQHVVVAPLALDAVGPELAAHDAAVGLERLERGAAPAATPTPRCAATSRGRGTARGCGRSGRRGRAAGRRPDR